MLVRVEFAFTASDLPTFSGQDLAYINIEATYENLFKSVDLWACGIGSWGGVGGKINHDAIGRPVKITPLSGKLDCEPLILIIPSF